MDKMNVQEKHNQNDRHMLEQLLLVQTQELSIREKEAENRNA